MIIIKKFLTVCYSDFSNFLYPPPKDECTFIFSKRLQHLEGDIYVDHYQIQNRVN